MLGQRVERGRAEPLPPLPPEFGRHPPSEMIGEDQDILRPGAKRGQRHHLEREAVEQIRAEGQRLDPVGQMLVGGGDDADVDADRPRRPDACHLAIFDRAQQPFLRCHRQRAQFVEEQRTAMRLLEPADPRLGRAGERARLMPEQFRLDQRFGQRGAVHHHQRLVPARGQAVEAFGDQFLAGPALADHQHRAVQRGRAAGAFERVEKGAGLADYLGLSFHHQGLAQFPDTWQAGDRYASVNFYKLL